VLRPDVHSFPSEVGEIAKVASDQTDVPWRQSAVALLLWHARSRGGEPLNGSVCAVFSRAGLPLLGCAVDHRGHAAREILSELAGGRRDRCLRGGLVGAHRRAFAADVMAGFGIRHFTSCVEWWLMARMRQ